MFLNLLLAAFLSAIISTAGYARGALSVSGALGAWLLGAIVFGAGGLVWAIPLIAFFVSSSLLSHYQARIKEPLAEKFQKGHRRDLGQVLANGGAAGLCAMAYAFSSQDYFFIAFFGALATVTADTWATELGVLSKRLPRLITTGRVVPAGTSGGITFLGTFIALCGAAFIGLTAVISNWLLASANFQSPVSNLSIISLSLISGLFGSLFDSFLGATAQVIYFCDVDQTETESGIHRCGRATRRVRGWQWLDNDGVNFISSAVGSLLAIGLYRLL